MPERKGDALRSFAAECKKSRKKLMAEGLAQADKVRTLRKEGSACDHEDKVARIEPYIYLLLYKSINYQEQAVEKLPARVIDIGSASGGLRVFGYGQAE